MKGLTDNSGRWTEKEILDFHRYIVMTGSADQMDRIRGRFGIKDCIAEHGKDKCDLMYGHLKAIGLE